MAGIPAPGRTVPMRARASTRDRLRELADLHGRSMIDELDLLVEQQHERLLLDQMLEGMAQPDDELAEWRDAPIDAQAD